jgi:murein DD-endopeptidase MepM/ murein hydrolase activator NlpD
MKTLFLTLCCIASLNAFCQLPDRQIHDLKTGRMKDDTSFVYWLPYKKGNSYLFIQGANSKMSHQNELSFDFKMKQGTSICAAREGVVIATKADSDHGGMKAEYLADGNHIIIQHADGSVAQYWHLKKDGVLVKVGDNVQKGQIIGLSGNTGYTAFPHLHFQVIDAAGKEILPRFETKKGNIYLRPGRWYKAVN